MENTTPSPLEAIHAAIKSQNVFAQAGIVRKQNVWDIKFPDVTHLNSHASDSVLQALEWVKTSELDKVSSIVVTASQGIGKTHLLKRVCYQGKRTGKTSFIYANVLNYTDLNLINYQFQQTIVDSLANLGSQEVTQWQEIATAMVNKVVKTPISPKVLIGQFDAKYNASLEKKQNLLDLLIPRICQIHKNTDPYIVRAILWTLSEKYSSYAVKWLAGNALEVSNAKFLKLPANLEKSNQDRESEALKIVQQILKLVGYYHAIIICFDEIETNVDKMNDAGLITPQVISLLVKSLYDTLHQSQLGKGVVILTVTLPDTWRNILNMMPGGIPDRLSTYTQREPIELKPIDGESMVELAKLWLRIFYLKKKVVPPHSIYPFDESQIRKYAKTEKPSVREAIKWFGDRFKIEDEILPKTPQKRFELALSREREEEFDPEILEDSDLLAEALQFGFTSAIGQKIDAETLSGEKINGLVIQEITEVTPKGKNNGWIHFKIVGTENNTEFKIGVSVLQHPHGLSVGAGMTRLIDYETFDLTRGCLVRSKDKKIKKNWDSYEYLNQLVGELGGEWVDLKLEEIKPILKFYGVYQQKEQYQISEEQVLEFARPEMLKNPLLLEILSNPSSGEDELIDPFDPEPSLDQNNVIDLELLEIQNSFDNGSDDSNDTNSPSEAQTTEKQDKDDETLQSSGAVKIEEPQDKKDINESSQPEKQWFEKNYKGKSIRSFIFLEQEYEVSTWKDFLMSVLTLIKLKHNRDLDKILTIKGRKRSFFSKNEKDLVKGEKLSGSNIYVEINLTANQTVKMSYQVIKLFDYPDNSISINLEENA